ncbi:cobalt ECF transporter T component CbiQ [Candidatus Aquicultor secundus]|uniref:cobalt ECF transporter T component CbiQ n=1 Tax=Candidatus Aquicultor secundus TaxID=1973895 RepID=UPI000CA789A6|nr:cobalt ECF transporter T component CbiQ [Candidatus Aquicultor secundus]PIX51860.1 MAG: cobalt ECF transporter T component CbiQ [Candidatus Aquicultor secundus]PIY41872.1 MAG: cobalt ECF transporter T component CbiQ [Candidatus Aquicultor secundus]
MLKIDQYAYINRIADMHPIEKSILALATMVICLAFSAPLTSVLVILFMAVLSILVAGIPARFYLKLMSLPLFFLVTGVLTVALNFTTTSPDSFLWGFRIGRYWFGATGVSLALAGNLFLKALGAVSCLYFLSLTTSMLEIFAMLKKLRLPPLFIELMSLVYRFIFVLLETTDRIYISQASRWGYANIKNTYRSLGQLVTNLFTKSHHNSQMLFTTLMSRCYQGELNVLENSYTLSKRNLLMITFVETALLVTGLWSCGYIRLL